MQRMKQSLTISENWLLNTTQWKININWHLASKNSMPSAKHMMFYQTQKEKTAMTKMENKVWKMESQPTMRILKPMTKNWLAVTASKEILLIFSKASLEVPIHSLTFSSLRHNKYQSRKKNLKVLQRILKSF